MRPWCSRWSSARVTRGAGGRGRSARAERSVFAFVAYDVRAEFDGGAGAEAGKFFRDGEGFVEVAAFEGFEAAEDFARFGEGAVGDDDFAVGFGAQGGRGGDGLEAGAVAGVAALDEGFVPGAAFLVDAVAFVGGEGVPALGIEVDEHDVLHGGRACVRAGGVVCGSELICRRMSRVGIDREISEGVNH